MESESTSIALEINNMYPSTNWAFISNYKLCSAISYTMKQIEKKEVHQIILYLKSQFELNHGKAPA